LGNKGKVVSQEAKEKIRKNHARLSGKDCPSWKGGISKVSHNLRAMFEYRLWVKYCIERDNYLCQKCKVVGGELEIHHKKPFIKIINENNIKTRKETECH